MRYYILANIIILLSTCSCQKSTYNISKLNINVLEYKTGNKLPTKAKNVNLIIDKITEEKNEQMTKYERLKSCFVENDTTISISALNNSKLVIHAYKDTIKATNYIIINKGEATVNLIME
jgi:hypothetical protein